MPAQIYDVWFLGNVGEINTDADPQSEALATFVLGTTFGSSGTPLDDQKLDVTLDDVGGVANQINHDVAGSGDTISYTPNGTPQTTELDYFAQLNVDIQYSDGDGATADIAIFQDTIGNLFAIRGSSFDAGTSDLYAKPIESITPNSEGTVFAGLAINRAEITESSDSFVILTDEKWDGVTSLGTQLFGNQYNLDGFDVSGTTTNIAESSTGRFVNGGDQSIIHDESGSGGAPDVYAVDATANLAGTQDSLTTVARIIGDLTLTDGQVIEDASIFIRVTCPQ